MNEDVTVVTEVKDTSPPIKEHKFEVLLDSDGLGSHITEHLNGPLKSISLNSTTLFETKIAVEGYNPIMDVTLNEPTQLYVRHQCSDENGQYIGEYSEYPLNEELEFKITGVPNSRIEVIIKYANSNNE